jgi:hypothetical protein
MSEPADEAKTQSPLKVTLKTAGRLRPSASPAELRQHAGRRVTRLIDPQLILALAAVVILFIGLFAAGTIHRSAHRPNTVHQEAPASLLMRPVPCFTPPYSGSSTSGTARSAVCRTTACVLTGANLAVNVNTGQATGSPPVGGSPADQPSTAASVDSNGQLASAPIVLPGQTAVVSFQGELNICGFPSETQATSIATALNHHSRGPPRGGPPVPVWPSPR